MVRSGGKMSNIIEEAPKQIEEMEKQLRMIDEFQCGAPQGCLKYQRRNENILFYHQYMDESTKKWDRKYIRKENIALAKDLAQKHYYTAVRPVLEKSLKELNKFITQYHPEEIEKIYDCLSPERKMLIVPLHDSKEARIQKWNVEKYETNDLYPENLKFETEQGDFVRSKSEVIIANLLCRYREDILYKYERPLGVLVDGRMKTIYPDFTILNVHTGKIMYWEHAGRMDDPNYASDFVKKVNTYVSNDLLPGRDVVFTYMSVEISSNYGTYTDYSTETMTSGLDLKA